MEYAQSCLGTYKDACMPDNARYTVMLQPLACCVTVSCYPLRMFEFLTHSRPSSSRLLYSQAERQSPGLTARLGLAKSPSRAVRPSEAPVGPVPSRPQWGLGLTA